MRRIGPLLLVALLGCRSEPRAQLRFEPVAADAVEDPVRISLSSAADARAALLHALDARPGAVTLVGEGAWETVAVVPPGREPRDVARAGRTFVRTAGAGVRMDVRLGAGDRGAFAGGVVPTGVERVMVQVRIEDAATVGGRFQLRILIDDGTGGAPPRDATPRYLVAPVPRGLYRAGLDIPSGGGRVLVGATSLDRGGGAVAQAWASPIAVERPWLSDP